MAYFLVALAVGIFFMGVAKLVPWKFHRMPWMALIVWAILLGWGAVIWLTTTHRL